MLTIKDLKKYIENLPDDMPVVVYGNYGLEEAEGFDVVPVEKRVSLEGGLAYVSQDTAYGVSQGRIDCLEIR